MSHEHRFWPSPDEDDLFLPGLVVGVILGVVGTVADAGIFGLVIWAAL